jgi:hypothetical protein
VLTVTPVALERLVEYRIMRRTLAGRALAGLPASEQQALAAAVPALHHLAERLAAR